MENQDLYEFEDYSDIDLIMYEQEKIDNFNQLYYEYYYIGKNDEIKDK